MNSTESATHISIALSLCLLFASSASAELRNIRTNPTPYEVALKDHDHPLYEYYVQFLEAHQAIIGDTVPLRGDFRTKLRHFYATPGPRSEQDYVIAKVSESVADWDVVCLRAALTCAQRGIRDENVAAVAMRVVEEYPDLAEHELDVFAAAYSYLLLYGGRDALQLARRASTAEFLRPELNAAKASAAAVQMASAASQCLTPPLALMWLRAMQDRLPPSVVGEQSKEYPLGDRIQSWIQGLEAELRQE